MRGKWLFFVVSLLFYLLQNVSNKEYGRRFGKGTSSASVLQNGMCVCFSAAVMALPGGIGPMPLPFMLLAMLFGCFYLLTVFLLLRAFSFGSIGGSTLLCNIGMFISALYGVFVFRDDFTAGIGVGMACMFGAVILSIPKDKGSGGMKWFGFALASGISNGIVASVKSTAVRLSGAPICGCFCSGVSLWHPSCSGSFCWYGNRYGPRRARLFVSVPEGYCSAVSVPGWGPLLPICFRCLR